MNIVSSTARISLDPSSLEFFYRRMYVVYRALRGEEYPLRAHAVREFQMLFHLRASLGQCQESLLRRHFFFPSL